jgi:hypothetical protein
MAFDGAHFSVAANIDMRGPTSQQMVFLYGTMTGDIQITLPTTASSMYFIDSTQITLSGGQQPHNILLTTQVGGTTTRTMAAGSSPGLWPVYVDVLGNVRFTNPLA